MSLRLLPITLMLLAITLRSLYSSMSLVDEFLVFIGAVPSTLRTLAGLGNCSLLSPLGTAEHGEMSDCHHLIIQENSRETEEGCN